MRTPCHMSYDLRLRAGAPLSGAVPTALHESSKLTDEELTASEDVAFLQTEASVAMGYRRKDTVPMETIEIQSCDTESCDIRTQLPQQSVITHHIYTPPPQSSAVPNLSPPPKHGVDTSNLSLPPNTVSTNPPPAPQRADISNLSVAP